MLAYPKCTYNLFLKLHRLEGDVQSFRIQAEIIKDSDLKP